MDNKTNTVWTKLLQNMRNHKYEDNNSKTQEKQYQKTEQKEYSKRNTLDLDTHLGTIQQLNRVEEMNKIKTETVNF